MEFEDVVQKRRSIRKFSPHCVEKEKIEKLLECARLCQSAKNRQPWKFMILENHDKNQIADIMLALFQQNNVELPGYMNSSKSSANIIKNAPLLILVFKDKDDDWQTGDLLSIGAAIEHICLEAVNLWLGALWIRDTSYTENEICKSVGYNDLQLVSAIAIGYPAESPSQRPRKAMEDIIIPLR
ncbi:nitroreductase family protein [Lachnoclostridium phytofermentans]|uniref:Nitroreductase n=1 Tax=Lachnoclostridium phytofermentans (strain ATCC 700394 / DSM 18823 / ISDg) TaxID=357809 RepID=A9KHQ7_LACP7|nr:nitroreductase family protein [Lachnoclostridium phytofermentans]ABX42342.1 nitroreductase [Lachnoclostridium phytofermentans ISDg]